MKLINYISRNDFLNSELKLDNRALIDLSKLTDSGHSFVGLTAILASGLDLRIQSVYTCDPWLVPIQKEITNGLLKKVQCKVFIAMNSCPFVEPENLNYFTGVDPKDILNKLMNYYTM